MLQVASNIRGHLFFNNRFFGLQMVQFDCPIVIQPLFPFTFEVHYGGPFSQHAGKGKCCIWLAEKVDFYL